MFQYTITLAETNGGTFNFSSWSQTITPTGLPPSTTNLPGSDFASLFGTSRVGPKSSVTSKQVGVCLTVYSGGTVFYTLAGTDSTGNAVTYTTPTVRLNYRSFSRAGGNDRQAPGLTSVLPRLSAHS